MAITSENAKKWNFSLCKNEYEQVLEPQIGHSVACKQ